VSVAAEYIIRLDDACPSMDARRWGPLEDLLLSRGIRPIAAIVPANADPALVRGPVDTAFWQRARSWTRAGWVIGLHGYSHVLRAPGGGLVPIQGHSEFVGLPIDEQRRRIHDGLRIFENNGLTPEIWVAPAHGFDSTTLLALRVESEIRIISDGLMRRAVHREGIEWLPQQLWHPRAFAAGLWTICLHPNEMDEASLRTLDAFLCSHAGSFPDPREAAARAVPYGPGDALFAATFHAALSIKSILSRRKAG
jgi:hypothetical protein